VSPSESIRLHRIHLPLLTPHVAAHGVETVRDVILVECRSAEGSVGWGECPTLTDPGYSAETTDVAWQALCGRGALGRMASGALADARLDARLRSEGRSLAAYLGASLTAVPTCTVVGLEAGVPDGDGPVKLKVTPETIGRLAVARASWPARSLAADANGSFGSPADLRGLDDVGLDYLEQPFPPGRPAAFAALRMMVSTPIALDESVASIDDLQAVVDGGAVDLVSIKPARLGGVAAAARVLAVASGLGLGAFVGGMLETGIGRATALALAACPGASSPTDLGPSSRYFDQDVCEPIEFLADDRLPVPDGPGIGRVPDTDRMAQVTVAFAEL
jgi:O-succinylbenzoate synthase